jgi:hypothetical protein
MADALWLKGDADARIVKRAFCRQPTTPKTTGHGAPRWSVTSLVPSSRRQHHIDYYLHMLPSIPAQHARRRLKLFSCHDGSAIPLIEKLLTRPRLLERIRQELTVK